MVNLDREKAVRNLISGILEAKKAGISIFIRYDGFEPYGLLTTRRSVETDRGPRLWGLGIKLEEGVLGKMRRTAPPSWSPDAVAGMPGYFAEPLDMWNPRLGGYEPIFRSGSGTVVTARKTGDLSDDPDNFKFFPTQLDVDEQRKKEMEEAEAQISVSSLRKELDSVREERDFWVSKAESLGEKVEDLKDRHSTLSKQVQVQGSIIKTYRLEAKVTQGVSTELEAAVGKVVEDAQERGIDFVRSDAERALVSAKRMRELRERMSALEERGPEDEFSELKGGIAGLRDEIEKVKSKVEEKG